MKIPYLVEFDETPRFWYPRVTLVAWIDFAFYSDKNLRSDFHRLKKKRRKKKSFSVSLHSHALPSPFLFFYLTFPISFFSFIIIIIIIWINSSYCLIRIRLYPEKIYFFSVHFILNELSSSHFLISKIFVKISFLESLTNYHPENRKKFHLSQNSKKCF